MHTWSRKTKADCKGTYALHGKRKRILQDTAQRYSTPGGTLAQGSADVAGMPTADIDITRDGNQPPALGRGLLLCQHCDVPSW